MSKNTFERTMRNIPIKDSNFVYKSKNDRKRKDDFTFEVQIDQSDQVRLNAFMRHELRYYNALIEGLYSRSRSNPESLLELEGEYMDLFGEIAAISFDIIKFQRSPKVENIPDELKKYEKILVGSNKENKKILNDKLTMILSIASTPAKILPNTRRSMALEILKFHKTQADILSKEHSSGDTIYKVAPNILEQVDIARKRHIQIMKKDVRFGYNEKEDYSWFQTSHIGHKIKVPNWDHRECSTWDILIIHQEPKTLVNSRSPWFIEIKTNNNSYFIKYLEVSNPYVGKNFNAAKRVSFVI